MNRTKTFGRILLGVLAVFILSFPLLFRSPYLIHIATLIFIWAFTATAWSYMGRFGLVSLGHGAFMGIGGYITVMLFNSYNISPWIGMILGALGAVLLAAVLGYACFRSGVIGDYFALVTLALGEVVALAVIAFREVTGGSLGLTVRSVGTSFWFLQSESKTFFYYTSLAFLIVALYVWRQIDRSRMQKALTAIGEDELAAASVGIKVIRYKMGITLISVFFTALGGVLYGQYITYINPHTVSGVAISLSIPFKAILGGMFNLWGPLIGSTIIVSLEEYFRVAFGTQLMGISEVIFGLALLLLIMFLPKGIYGTLKERWLKRQERTRKQVQG